MISSPASFKISKVNPFPTLAATFLIILLSNLCIYWKLFCLLVQADYLWQKEQHNSMLFLSKLASQEPKRTTGLNYFRC